MTKAQAIALAKTEWWKGLPARTVASFQLAEEKLCMDFGAFHEAVEKALGRPVWTHEFADTQRLLRELNGNQPAPTMDEIIDMIPTKKRILVVTPGGLKCLTAIATSATGR